MRKNEQTKFRVVTVDSSTAQSALYARATTTTTVLSNKILRAKAIKAQSWIFLPRKETLS